MKTVTWVRFTEEDWMGFSGAERFADKSAPYIATLKIGGTDALAVLDATGIGVFACDSTETLVLRAEDGNVANAALAMVEETTLRELLVLGFVREEGWSAR